MSDSLLDDPRYTVIAGVLMGADNGIHADISEVIDLLDAADRAAGVVRVDTNDEALVERLSDDLGLPTWRILAALRESA